MKKLLIYSFLGFFCLLYTITDYHQHNNGAKRVRTDMYSQVYLDRFVELMDKNHIEIDWKRIESVNFLPLKPGLHGVYFKKSKVIMVNPEQAKAFKEGVYDDFILLILAHEIGHSQGWAHEGCREAKLMSCSDYAAFWAINKIGIERYILDAYQFPKQRTYFPDFKKKKRFL